MTGPTQYFKQFERKKTPRDKLDFTSSVLAKLAKFQVYDKNAKEADDFFEAILPILETDLIEAGAGHDAFVASLVKIACGYSKALSPEAEEEEDGFFFHETYDKAILIIVGMMENSSSLKIFFETLRGQDLVVPFAHALGGILPLDISYITQVEHDKHNFSYKLLQKGGAYTACIFHTLGLLFLNSGDGTGYPDSPDRCHGRKEVQGYTGGPQS